MIKPAIQCDAAFFRLVHSPIGLDASFVERRTDGSWIYYDSRMNVMVDDKGIIPGNYLLIPPGTPFGAPIGAGYYPINPAYTTARAKAL